MFKLPPLPYAYDALAPYMSAKTLEFHHDKHHLAYVENANKLIKDTSFAEGVFDLDKVVAESYVSNTPLFNNAAQHYNHVMFWQCMKKNGGGSGLPGTLQKMIDEQLGGYDGFRAGFIQAALAQFGSGWVWLVVKQRQLAILKTPNAENPLVHDGGEPILCLDVWEHSYYIDHYNDRRRYVEVAFDHLFDWDYVGYRLDSVS